jgi:putative transposase
MDVGRPNNMELVHVLNRGVDKRKIFLDDDDYLRAIHDLFEFNDEAPAGNLAYFFRTKPTDVGRPYIEGRRTRRLLVKIHIFCLMPNHYHMILSEVAENGIQRFMKKFNGGYAKYFNEKYDRTGALFEGRYKKINIEKDAHFTYLPYYIHFNPLDLVAPEWRERKLKNFTKAMKFLDSYRWSSHLDYSGKKNFPSVTQRDLILESFGSHAQYKSGITGWLQELSLESIRGETLE